RPHRRPQHHRHIDGEAGIGDAGGEGRHLRRDSRHLMHHHHRRPLPPPEYRADRAAIGEFLAGETGHIRHERTSFYEISAVLLQRCEIEWTKFATGKSMANFEWVTKAHRFVYEHTNG